MYLIQNTSNGQFLKGISNAGVDYTLNSEEALKVATVEKARCLKTLLGSDDHVIGHLVQKFEVVE